MLPVAERRAARASARALRIQVQPSCVDGQVRRRGPGVPEGHVGLVSALLESDGYDGLGALGAFGHPGELNQMGALHLGEAAIVRPDAAFVLDREVVQTIDHWIEDDALGAVPRSARAFGSIQTS